MLAPLWVVPLNHMSSDYSSNIELVPVLLCHDLALIWITKSIDNFKPLKEWIVGKDVNIYCEKGKLVFDMLAQYHMVVDAMKTQRKK